ncbi:hypothetical protein DIPPA_13287 [Diplonema papillatum]|nr:hypothetical protein DIPPA_13287 [Diplonema papillatum]KAJ9464102.1 hypothetical protein DIPPA_13287 [Diplonema papillatum]
MPMENKFFVGFFPPEHTVQQITELALARVGDKLRAVNVYNESAILETKFAWMAVEGSDALQAAKDGFGADFTVVHSVPDAWDETEAEFKHRAYLSLALLRDEGKLVLTKPVVDFCIKDTLGGCVIEKRVRARMASEKEQPLEALVAVLADLLPDAKFGSVVVDATDVANALKYCETRRTVARLRQQQETADGGLNKSS